jgi:hypothetical protein
MRHLDTWLQRDAYTKKKPKQSLGAMGYLG